MKKALHIFYKDLNFNNDLLELASDYRILPLFLWSEQLNQGVDATPSLRYRLQWARAFDTQMLPQETHLLVVRSLEEIETIIKLYQVDVVSMSRHFEPREHEFQKRLAIATKQLGCQLKLFDNYLAVAPERSTKKDGSAYLRFTPFYHNWRKKIKVVQPRNHQINWLEQPICTVLADDGMRSALQTDLKQISWFMREGFLDYADNRDYPSLDGTSHLSALLNHGVISVQQIVNQALTHREHERFEPFLRQLAWRDFYNSILYYYPTVVEHDFNQSIKPNWSNQAFDYYQWCEGKTGYPLIDAAMRALYQTGRMPGRLRMVSAGFLVKHLQIDWREGANWFKEHLIDYDLACNIGGWQWAASTGPSAMRVSHMFNPYRQSHQYDRQAVYMKRYLPQLESCDSKCFHQPDCIAQHYIKPIIDHDHARQCYLNRPL